MNNLPSTKTRKISKYVKFPTHERRTLCHAFLKAWMDSGSQNKAAFALREQGFRTNRGTYFSVPTLQTHFRRWILYDPKDAQEWFTNPELCGQTMTETLFERMRIELAFVHFRKQPRRIWDWAEMFGLKDKYFDALKAFVEDGIEADYYGDEVPVED